MTNIGWGGVALVCVPFLALCMYALWVSIWPVKVESEDVLRILRAEADRCPTCGKVWE